MRKQSTKLEGVPDVAVQRVVLTLLPHAGWMAILWLVIAFFSMLLNSDYCAAFNAMMVAVTINIYESRYKKMRQNEKS